MIKVKDKRALRSLPAQKGFVIVESVDQIYVSLGDEWIEKSYFTIKEAVDILKLKRDEIYYYMIGLKMVTVNGRRNYSIKISLQQLKTLIKAKQMKLQDEELSITDIRKKL